MQVQQRRSHGALGFRPSILARDVAQQANISLAGDGWRGNVKTTRLGRSPPTGLSTGIWPQHVLHPWHQRFLEPSGHPLCYAMLDRYVEKAAAEPLWWWAIFSTGTAQNYRAWMNQKQRRRIGKAFREALKTKGYDAAGRRMARDASSPAAAAVGPGPGPGPIEELYGTVGLFSTYDNVLKLSYTDLLAYCLDLVPMVERSLGRRAGDAASDKGKRSLAAAAAAATREEHCGIRYIPLASPRGTRVAAPGGSA